MKTVTVSIFDIQLGDKIAYNTRRVINPTFFERRQTEERVEEEIVAMFKRGIIIYIQTKPGDIIYCNDKGTGSFVNKVVEAEMNPAPMAAPTQVEGKSID